MDRVEVRKGVFLHSSGALYMPDSGVAAVADLHIGFEAALSESGATMPRAQRHVLLDRMKYVLEELKPRKLVVVGDLKHNFDRNLSQEWEEVEEIVEWLSKRCELVVVRGNHDNYLVSILRRRGVLLEDSVEIDGIAFAHGHKDLEWKGLLVMGHEHPSAGLRDPVGGMVKLPCFLYHNGIGGVRGGKSVVVLPAMSPLATGTDVIRAGGFFSPVLKNFSMDAFGVWAISHIGLLELGTVSALGNAVVGHEQW
ncbi:MAG: metallophosphoesterase [Candidatus Thermoplasmatota archaeon]|nr:metallophosphoesterase [Candidatus Thermoplasmatota archaeon]